MHYSVYNNDLVLYGLVNKTWGIMMTDFKICTKLIHEKKKPYKLKEIAIR